MIPNGYLMFEDENFIESSVAKLNALRKSGQFCDVRLQVFQTSLETWGIEDFFFFFFEAFNERTLTCVSHGRRLARSLPVPASHARSPAPQVCGHEMLAHRAVLACCSPYLFEIFNSDSDPHGVSHVKLDDLNPEAVEVLLNYAYTAQ